MQPVDPSQLFRFARQEAERIDEVLRQDLVETTAAADPLLAESLTHALFAGGKRIRPLLVLLAMRLCRPGYQGQGTDDGHRLAIAFEYLHAATLIHDDVVDQAGERRGRAALWQSHGLAAAILAGDWLHARAMYLIGLWGGSDGLAVFCRATAAMVAGEFWQLRHRNDPAQSEARHLEIIECKTAGLIAAACEIGALFAGASPAARAALADYGRHIGLAFQLVDDILDYQGQAAATGKRPGTDWIEGQLTLPLIHVLRQGGEEGRQLTRLLALERAAHLDEARALIESGGGFQYARALAEQYGARARSALHQAFQATASAELPVLLGLVDFVLCRDR